MEDIRSVIVEEIESDPLLKATDIGIEVSAKGFIKRRKAIRVFGAVHSQDAKSMILRIVRRHAGDNFDVMDEIAVH